MASIDKLRASDGSGNASVATVQNTRSGGASTIIVDTVQGINTNFFATMGTPHTFTDPVTSETITVISEATAVDFVGHVDGSNLEIDAIAPGYVDNGSAVGDIVIIRPTTQWADEVADILDVAHEDNGQLKSGAANRAINPQQGFMINGKIVRSVASNNITVAIKTLAGADPSTTDPVYVYIGDTVRSITAALSVTKNAGTNWFNSGSTALATFEIDYFVYLGHNATDGVTIGFARIPYASTYADFSTTTTNEKYCAISTITNAAATDEYENIGRFNATLSATASFNWSVPATSLVISRPIFESRILSYAGAWTAAGTAPALGNATIIREYQVVGRKVFVRWTQTNGTTTTYGTSEYSFGLPFSQRANVVAHGEAWAHDIGSSYFSGITKVDGSGSIMQAYNSASASNAWGQLVPHTWANTDRLTLSLTMDIG